MAKPKISSYILEAIRQNSKDSDCIKEFLTELIYEEANHTRSWWFKEFYRKKLDEYCAKFAKDNEKVCALVWTTTPWTLPSNVALCFHPDFNYSYIKKDGEYLIVAEKFVESYKDYEKVKQERDEYKSRAEKAETKYGQCKAEMKKLQEGIAPFTKSLWYKIWQFFNQK